ncbi:acyltransferase [Sphingomonas sp. PAMC26645]|uniref:acyltransferase family protein n=1 Tax=Sphingomonas sp. PAMC26645 TaxID=2565555 RepID=UPI00109E11A0|nr:acyltransferase [Sphingomonas sp. PAMC26645]QCB43841.1 acyltransferase [Sphingomonas sp. PAMC26645]
MTPSRIAPIQWLRALAATLVLMMHASDMIDSGPVALTGKFVPSVPNLSMFGASGVDLFFVISGFVMAQSLATADADSWRFLAKRWLRIVPLFACVSAVYMLIMHDPLTVPAAWMSITVLPVLDGAGYHVPALYPGWTLGFEFAFYAIVAVAMRAPQRRVETLLALTVALALIGSVVHPGWAPLRLLLNPLLLEFALGVGAWMAWHSGISARYATPALGIGTVLLVVGIAFGLGVPLPLQIEVAVAGTSGFARTWTWGIPWALVVVGVIDTVAEGRFERVVARVGDASYSTYLTHPCLIALLWMVGGYAPTMSPYLFALAFIVASTMLGLAVHRWIERPLLARLQRRPSVSIRRAPALA